MRSAWRTSPPSNLPYLLEWTPQLLLFSCLERCDIYLRVATIPGWLAFKVCACTCYCSHMIYIIVQRTCKPRQVNKAFCFDSIVRGHYVYQTVLTPFLGELLTATPEPKNDHNRHAVCVKDGEIADHVPRIKCSLLYSGHFQSFTSCLHTCSCHDDYYECC